MEMYLWTHQAPIGEESGPTPNPWLDHLQRDILGHLDKVPVKVDGIDELGKSD